MKYKNHKVGGVITQKQISEYEEKCLEKNTASLALTIAMVFFIASMFVDSAGI